MTLAEVQSQASVTRTTIGAANLSGDTVIPSVGHVAGEGQSTPRQVAVKEAGFRPIGSREVPIGSRGYSSPVRPNGERSSSASMRLRSGIESASG
jgi:hypothetical protein